MADSSEILQLTSDLIAIPSLAPDEQSLIRFLRADLEARGWKVESISVAGSTRCDLFVAFGTPEIVFTTHIDVVPGPEKLFKPRVENDSVWGRGACDAKGIAATMIAVAQELLRSKETGFGLLFVVGEEDDGIGAKTAAHELKHRGIRFVIDGEPTENKLVLAHKGSVSVRISFAGRACHSGYPELGDDANAKLIRAACVLMDSDFGRDPVLGSSSVLCGVISGGVAGNVVSPRAELNVSVRTVSENEAVLDKIKACVPQAESFEVTYNCPPTRCLEVPGFDTTVVAFGTDIPHFAELGAQCLLYGPGSIFIAHTDQEHIDRRSIDRAVEDYCSLFRTLRKRAFNTLQK